PRVRTSSKSFFDSSPVGSSPSGSSPTRRAAVRQFSIVWRNAPLLARSPMNPFIVFQLHVVAVEVNRGQARRAMGGYSRDRRRCRHLDFLLNRERSGWLLSHARAS